MADGALTPDIVADRCFAMLDMTLAGAVHSTLALVAIAIGAVQLLRRKGDATHRAMGYAYVYALLIADGAAMLVFQFTGKLNILHFGVLTNLVCIGFGMWPVLRSPHRPNFRVTHYMWMSWSYIGVLAAAGTEMVVRGPLHPGTRWQAWAATAAVTAGVTFVGWVLIERHRPNAPSA